MRNFILVFMLFMPSCYILAQEESIPIFPGCNIGSEDEKRSCSDQALKKYFSENLVYPDLAKKNGIEGLVIAKFVISKDSIIKDVTIPRGIGFGCNEVALKLILDMNNFKEKWIPARLKGKNVDFNYTVPVKFAFTSKKK